MAKSKIKRVEVLVSAEEYSEWEAIAKEGRSNIGRMVRAAIRQVDRVRLAYTLRQAA